MTDQNAAIVGLIHAVALDGKGGGQDMLWEQLELPRSADSGPLWVHIYDRPDGHERRGVTGH